MKRVSTSMVCIKYFDWREKQIGPNVLAILFIEYFRSNTKKQWYKVKIHGTVNEMLGFSLFIYFAFFGEACDSLVTLRIGIFEFRADKLFTNFAYSHRMYRGIF